METKQHRKSPERFVILGLLIALVLALGGIGLAGGAPSSIHTCTVIKTGKMKIAASCRAGKQIGTTWDNHDVVVANQSAALTNAQRYQRLLKEGNFRNGTCGATTVSYAGIDLSYSQASLCMRNGPNNFRGANLRYANLRNSSFNDTDFTGADFSFSSLFWEVSLFAADYRNNNFTNATFDNSELVAVDFTGSVMTNVHWGDGTICPDGHGSAEDGNTCVGHGYDNSGHGPGHGGL